MEDRVQSIENAVRKLNPAELRKFAAWFTEYDQTSWEEEIERDSTAGRLDFLIEEARAEQREGKLKEL